MMFDVLCISSGTFFCKNETMKFDLFLKRQILLQYILKHFCCTGCTVVESFIVVKCFVPRECGDQMSFWLQFNLLIRLDSEKHFNFYSRIPEYFCLCLKGRLFSSQLLLCDQLSLHSLNQLFVIC